MDPVVALGIQLLPVHDDNEPPLGNVKDDPEVLEDEGMSDWMMNADSMDGYILVAEMSNYEALEPQSLAEAKQHLD